jgi:broad specificity phosphatase PhoE
MIDDKILNSSPWGKPALELLSHANELIPEVPALILVRHSEREKITKEEEMSMLGLNPKGLQAAHEFGCCLPTDRSYYFYHSRVSRCEETAARIREGVQKQGGIVNSIKEMKSLYEMHIEPEIIFEKLKRDGRYFVYNWIAGHYPPSEISLSQDIAQRIALEMIKILQSAHPSDFHVFVSHDWQVTLALFYWAGILLTDDYIQFLDGFIFQYYNGKLIFYYKNGKKEVSLPYWWRIK